MSATLTRGQQDSHKRTGAVPRPRFSDSGCTSIPQSFPKNAAAWAPPQRFTLSGGGAQASAFPAHSQGLRRPRAQAAHPGNQPRAPRKRPGAEPVGGILAGARWAHSGAGLRSGWCGVLGVLFAFAPGALIHGDY